MASNASIVDLVLVQKAKYFCLSKETFEEQGNKSIGR